MEASLFLLSFHSQMCWISFIFASTSILRHSVSHWAIRSQHPASPLLWLSIALHWNGAAEGERLGFLPIWVLPQHWGSDWASFSHVLMNFTLLHCWTPLALGTNSFPLLLDSVHQHLPMIPLTSSSLIFQSSGGGEVQDQGASILCFMRTFLLHPHVAEGTHPKRTNVVSSYCRREQSQSCKRFV